LMLDKQSELKQDIVVAEKNDSIQKILPELSDDNLADNQGKKDNFEFGVELASVSSYATNGTSSNLNLGGGFLAAYKLTKKLSLSTGMVISKQDLAYNNSDNLYAAPGKAEYAASNSLNMIDGNSAESDISFVSIDIPMNLKYRIKKFILSAGISSLLFVNEKNSYNYEVVTNSIAYNTTTSMYESINSTRTVTRENKEDSFSHFDFAGLFNLSVAYDMPLPKGSLAFEPYLKLPLASVSSQDIKMGSGGVTVRYNF